MNQRNDVLLELICKELPKGPPIYRLSREPTRLDELDWNPLEGLVIQRENRTIICVSPATLPKPDKRYVSFEIDQEGKTNLQGTIYGQTDAAIAETAAFFWSLRVEETALLAIKGMQKFDFAALSTEQITRFLDANPERMLGLESGIWNTDHSIVLATRPYPIHLALSGDFAFQDDGTAFVDALQNRQYSFGSFWIAGDQGFLPFCRTNLERLLQLDNVFEKLAIGYLNEECILLPFTTKADALEYEVVAEDIPPGAFDSIAISTKDLTLRIHVEGTEDNWAGLLVSFLDRAAELGHFEKLGFLIDFQWSVVHDEVAPIAKAFVRAINGNPELSQISLSDLDKYYDWAPHLQSIFKAMEEHEGLSTVIADDKNWEDRTYSWLEQLLSGNRSIEVLDTTGERISNGPRIDKIYSMNYFLNGSAQLVKEQSTSLRSLLVATALTESAYANLDYTSLLLSNHTDTLCEYIDCVDLDTAASATGLIQKTHHHRPHRSAKQEFSRHELSSE